LCELPETEKRPETTNRFVSAVARLTRGAPADYRIGLAVSGGPDSLALLLLAHQAFPGRICAATVDHGLRPEAADEAQYVATLCAGKGIKHYILAPAAPITGNIQSAARTTRYALLEQWADENACAFIATAHHADDQLETMLMRQARGSGIDGLAGVRAINGRIIRPLLGFTKDDLIGICSTAGIKPVEDPSNGDAAFDRVRMRQWLASGPHPMDSVAANRSAGALADASSALDWTARHFADTRISEDASGYTLDPQGMPRELQRRLLLIVIKALEPASTPRGEAVERVIDALIAGEKVTLGNIACTGGLIWHFGPAPKRRSVQKTQE
jgi:tRNA(Ile)-lysidine synthase